MNSYTTQKVIIKKYIKVTPKTKKLNIYKIVNPNIPGKCYVGSTAEPLKDRFSKHKYDAERFPNRKFYKECGGIENCEIELLQTLELPLPKFDLERRKQEQAWIEQLKPDWNNLSAFMTSETRAETQRRYNQSEKGRERHRRWREKQKALRSDVSD